MRGPHEHTQRDGVQAAYAAWHPKNGALGHSSHDAPAGNLAFTHACMHLRPGPCIG